MAPTLDVPTLDTYLRMAKQLDVSDVHIAAGAPPIIRHNGVLKRAKTPNLTDEDTKRLIFDILDDRQKKIFAEEQELDFSYVLHGVGRFRVNVFEQRKGIDAALRLIPEDPPTLDDLGFPSVVKKLLNYRQGLILVTGKAGSGKTTTLAAMVNYLNMTRKEHIITVEDPIEVQHEPKLCHVVQREVGPHTESFASALRAALREDPDIIMVGEMRDLETIQLAITAAETGHLVMATLHTTSAARTIDRLLDVFPPAQQPQIRAMVAESLRGIMTQQLLTGADNRTRVLGLEVLVVNPAVSNLIRDGKTFQIPQSMQTGSKLGMKLMDDHLMELIESFKITHETAISRCNDPTKFPTLEEMQEKMIDWQELIQMDDKAKWKLVNNSAVLEYSRKEKEFTIHRERIPFVFYITDGQLPIEQIDELIQRLVAEQGEKKGGLAS